MARFGIPTTNRLLADERLADVWFKIMSDEDQPRIAGHKMILAAASEVLEKMLYGDLAEGAEIEIVDASAAAFNQFKRFIYTNELDLTSETVPDVMNLARKYDVPQCFAYCEQFLEHHLTDENVFSGFQLAVLFNVDHLKEKIGKRVGEQANSVFASDDFANCSLNVLRGILEIKFLACNPEDVFDACMKWTKAACKTMKMRPSMANRRQQLADCLYLIPFRQMQPTSVSYRVQKFKRLFDRGELKELMEVVAIPQSLRLGKFNSTSTLADGFDKILQYTCLYHKVDATPHYINKSEVSTFFTIARYLLTAVQLLTIRYQPHGDGRNRCKRLIATLSVVEKPSDESHHKIVLKQQIKIEVCSMGSDSTKRIALKESILDKNKRYEIRIDFDSGWTENTFFADIPYPDENKWNGLVRDVFHIK